MNTTTVESPTTTLWNIDPAHTLVEFSAKHMMITTVKGRFSEIAGSVHVDEENPDRSQVEATIQAASVDTSVEQRDQHLKSSDFLDVENYPAIIFRSREVRGAHKEVGDTFQLVGDLTIRGTTREVVLDVTYEGTGPDPWGGTRASFSAETQLDRRDFGLTWNQALEAGGVLVSNKLKLSVEVQLVKQG